MNKILFLLIFASIFQRIFPEDRNFPVSSIPPSLLENSKAVIRKNDITFEIYDPGSALEKVDLVMTILNENGIEYSKFVQFYNKFQKIRSVKITLYDVNGKEVKSFNFNNLKDYSAISGYSLYEDSRVKYLDPAFGKTPFTVEFSYEVKYDGLFSYPDWHVYPDYNISVQSSTFRILTPHGFGIRFHERNLKDSCRSTENGLQASYFWKAENQPAIKKEPYSLDLEEYTPVVLCAPNDFIIDGLKGNAETWKNLGSWIFELGKGKDVLDEPTKLRIRAVAAQYTDRKDQIKALYEFMQNKVRYVNLTIGIGGWQPINAQTVDKLSYGDCKALSNYMKTILDVAGIKAEYTIVKAGENETQFMPEFPSNRFNHAIICIPGNDTIWLECTSQRIPFGYIGTFTDDRKALLITDEGGKLVRTRVYGLKENRRDTKGIIMLKDEGNAESEFVTSNGGLFYDEMIPLLMMDEADRGKSIRNSITVPNFTLESYSVNELKQENPVITQKLKMTMHNYYTLAGNRIILNVFPMSKIKELPVDVKERRSPIFIRRSSEESDTIIFKVPSSFVPESLPPKKNLKTRFGEFSTELSFHPGELRAVRNLKLFKGQYPVADYGELVAFFNKIALSDLSRISFLSSQ